MRTAFIRRGRWEGGWKVCDSKAFNRLKTNRKGGYIHGIIGTSHSFVLSKSRLNSRSGTTSEHPPCELESGAGLGFGADGAAVPDAGTSGSAVGVGVGTGAATGAATGARVAAVVRHQGGGDWRIMGCISENITSREPYPNVSQESRKPTR